MKLREALQMKLNGEVEDIILINCNGIHRLPHLDYDVEVTYPKPLTETVEVKRWFCTECGCNQGYQGTNRCCNKELVVLAGTYEREIKPKVKKREEINPNKWPIAYGEGFGIPADAKFFAEWSEDAA